MWFLLEGRRIKSFYCDIKTDSKIALPRRDLVVQMTVILRRFSISRAEFYSTQENMTIVHIDVFNSCRIWDLADLTFDFLLFIRHIVACKHNMPF